MIRCVFFFPPYILYTHTQYPDYFFLLNGPTVGTFRLPSFRLLVICLLYLRIFACIVPVPTCFLFFWLSTWGGGMPFYFLLGDIFDFNTSTFSITDVYNILICPYTPLDFILGLQRGKLRESYIGSTMQQLYMIGWNSIRSGIFASNTTI